MGLVMMFIQEKDWENLKSTSLGGFEPLIVCILLVLTGFVGYRVIGTISQRYSDYLDRKDVDVSESGVIRLRRHDTRARVMASLMRAALGLSLLLVAVHQLMPNALLGTAMLAAAVGFALQPLIRDTVGGSMMMIEGWFQVGDRIHVEPHDLSGVVEHFNLRSTQLRTVAGERVIIHNSSIWSVSIARQGVHQLTMELVVRDPDRGRQLIEHASEVLPAGHSHVVRALRVGSVEQLSTDMDLYRLISHATMAPGRDWLLEDFAVKLLPEIEQQLWPDESVIVHGPIVYNADRVAEDRIRQSVRLAQLT